MPLSAIRTGCVDYILFPEDMRAIILAHVNHNFNNSKSQYSFMSREMLAFDNG
jgi:hypothetical protein